MTDSISTRVEQLLAELLHDFHGSTNFPIVTSNSEFSEDLGMDDLDVIEAIHRAEQAFEVEVADDEITCTSCVGDLVALIKRRVAAKHAWKDFPEEQAQSR